MNRSPERNTFQLNAYLERCREDGEEPNENYIELYRGADIRDMEKEENAQWKLNNLEYDLRSTKWICDKAKASEAYAQNLYAAMCNNNFQKLEVWPLLKGETYSCSWRYAGGIIADMVETGDYIDWYCSGIGGGATEDELAAMTEEDRAKYHWYKENFVSESVVTDEVKQDLEKLGWKVVDKVDE